MAGEAPFSSAARSADAARAARTSVGLQERQLDAAANGVTGLAVPQQPVAASEGRAAVSAQQSEAVASAVRQPAAEPRSGFAGDVEALAGLLPAPAPLEPRPGGSIVDSVAAILAMALVASLLLAMTALVARFLRGSWNP